MYPPSSSSSQKPVGPTSSGSSGGGSGLIRYVSAPGSLFRTAVDSVIGSQPSLLSHHHHHYYNNNTASGDHSSSCSSFTTESTCKVNSSNDPNNNNNNKQQQHNETGSYGFSEIPQTLSAAAAASTSSSLLRQRSSPAGFLSHFTPENGGFSVTRETENYNSQGGSNGCGNGVSRVKSQLSFTRQDCLSQTSEVSENGIDGVNSGSGRQNAIHSYANVSFEMDSWENGNSIVFSPPPNKRSKTLDGDTFNYLNALETQFSMPQTSLEMATVEKLMHIPEDSVPCKIRAKRGFATHPRSIAERLSLKAWEIKYNGKKVHWIWKGPNKICGNFELRISVKDKTKL